MNDIWTIEKIKIGFEKFFAENGRLPIAPEIDKLEYLPTSRQIQRKFGGLEKLRTTLGYEQVHFGKGDFRGKISLKVGLRGRESEILLQKLLDDKFGEIFVHTEKLYGDYKNRLDFYIYSPTGNFGIDIFFSDTKQDLQKNINIKLDKYKSFPEKLFLVVGNDAFSQEALDKSMQTKKKPLLPNITVVCVEKFKQIIQPMGIYRDPQVFGEMSKR